MFCRQVENRKEAIVENAEKGVFEKSEADLLSSDDWKIRLLSFQ